MTSIPLNAPSSSGNMFTRISASLNTPKEGKKESFWGCVKSVVNNNETLQSIKIGAQVGADIGASYLIGGGIGSVVVATATTVVGATAALTVLSAIGVGALIAGGVLVVGAGVVAGLGTVVLALREYRSEGNRTSKVESFDPMDIGKESKGAVDASNPSYGTQEKRGVPKDGINASNPNYGQGRDNPAFEAN